MQTKKGGVICLLYIDLDDFKQTNDRWGHGESDKALKVLADIIRNQLRSLDNIGRIGGDECVASCIFNDRKQANNLVLRI